MDSHDYDAFVRDNWSRRKAGGGNKPKPSRDLYIMATGLAGETGEVLELLKKHVRDGEIDTHALLLELGDVLHYLTRIAAQYGLSLPQVMDANVVKLEQRARERGW
jgi:NTP pyrophosphatase (non-canonical NTP hydrolase)